MPERNYTDKPLENPESSYGETGGGTNLMSVVPVSKEEFNALKNEFQTFKTRTEIAIRKPQEPADADFSSSLPEYWPVLVLVLILVVVIGVILKILYDVKKRVKELSEGYEKLLEKLKKLEKAEPAGTEISASDGSSKKDANDTKTTSSSNTVKKNSLIQDKPKNTSPPATMKSSTNYAENPTSSADKKNSLTLADCIKEFNAIASAENPELSRKNFVEKYDVMVFRCTNSGERLDNSSLAPKFEWMNSTNSGEYWAVLLEENLYAVFPNVQVYTVSLHRAMSYLFEAANFNSSKTYNRIYVEKPAEINGYFECVSKGILRLSNDEY